jgi:hypothetical protein
MNAKPRESPEEQNETVRDSSISSSLLVFLCSLLLLQLNREEAEKSEMCFVES